MGPGRRAGRHGRPRLDHRGDHRGPALSDPAGRLSLLLTSPRLAPGLLSREAWRRLEEAAAVLTRDPEPAQASAIRAAGIPVTPLEEAIPAAVARALLDRAEQAPVVWVGSPDGDPGLTDALALEATRRGAGPELEVLIGSWDQPGARLLDVVAVMDRLRSPGGCPWDAEQTHQSLVPYLIEEAHEAVEALESGDDDHIAEELGDVLLQVVFHARVGAEREDGFDIDDVAGMLVDKLVHRHPHVFAEVDAADAAAVEANWEQLKAAEKPHREHPLDGIPAGMPALARAVKVASRLERAGHGAWLREQVEQRSRRATGPAGAVATDPAGAVATDPAGAVATDPAGAVATGLLRLVLEAREQGVDPAAALRGLLRELADEPVGEPVGEPLDEAAQGAARQPADTPRA